MTILDDRERAAEFGFAHGEELRFIEMRCGIEELGLWTAGKIGATEPAAYAASLVADMIAGSGEMAILDRVREDLARAGKADAFNEAEALFTRSKAEAHDHLHGINHGQVGATLPPESSGAATTHSRNAFWGWET